MFLPFLDKLCPHTKLQQHIDFPMEFSVLKFQTWQFGGKPLFKIAILNDQNTFEISPSHFWLSHV